MKVSTSTAKVTVRSRLAKAAGGAANVHIPDKVGLWHDICRLAESTYIDEITGRIVRDSADGATPVPILANNVKLDPISGFATNQIVFAKSFSTTDQTVAISATFENLLGSEPVQFAPSPDGRTAAPNGTPEDSFFPIGAWRADPSLNVAGNYAVMLEHPCPPDKLAGKIQAAQGLMLSTSEVLTAGEVLNDERLKRAFTPRASYLETRVSALTAAFGVSILYGAAQVVVLPKSQHRRRILELVVRVPNDRTRRSLTRHLHAFATAYGIWTSSPEDLGASGSIY